MKLTTVSLLILLTNCITPPKAVDVDSTKTMSPAKRQQIFESNKIKEGGLFTSYQVGTESYAGEQLTPLFDATYASEDAKSKYSSGQTLNTIGSIFAMGGGFAIGWNLGTASRGQSAEPGLYIGGGVAILTAFVFGYFANENYAEASKIYNNDLLRALELDQKVGFRPSQFNLQNNVEYQFGISHRF